MSLLPEVERELRRVAREPRAQAQARPASRLPGGLLVVAVTVVAIALAVGFIAALGHRSGGGPPGGSPAGGPVPGAPHTQKNWYVASGACPLAPRSRYLPRRSGCVSVVRADVDGDGRSDLAVLYARLGHRAVRMSSGPVQFRPLGFTLELVRASGGVVRVGAARIGGGEFDDALVRYGNVNGVPGDELFVEVERISSGMDFDVYGFSAGRLVRAKVTLQAGGDSADKEGFSCRTGPRPEIVQRIMNLDGPLPAGPWRWTVTTYAWHGVALRRVSRHSFTRRGRLSRAATADGGGCGRAVAGGER